MVMLHGSDENKLFLVISSAGSILNIVKSVSHLRCHIQNMLDLCKTPRY